MLSFILRAGTIACLLVQLVGCSLQTGGIVHDRFTDYSEEERVPPLILPQGLALLPQDTHYDVPRLPEQNGLKKPSLYPPGSRLHNRK